MEAAAAPAANLSHRRLTWSLAVAQLISWGVIYYSFSVFLVPMEQELGWSRTALTGALALGLIASGIAAPFVGAWIDRHGGRDIMTAGTVLAAVMVAAWAWVPSYGLFCAAWIALGIAQAMTLYEPAFAVLHRELENRAPAAIARVTLVAGLASTAFVPMSYWLISAVGWRGAALALAAIVLLLCTPLYWQLPRGPRQPRTRATARVSPWTPLRTAAGKRAFWGLLVTYAGGGLVFGAITFHIIPLLLERGLGDAVAVFVVAAIGPLQVLGRVVILVLWRDLRARLLGRVVTAGLALSILILIAIPGLAGALGFALLYGASNGIATILRGIAAAEMLGRESFGSINGALTTPASFARAVAPAIAGALWAAGGYALVLWFLLATAAVSVAAFWIASAEKFPNTTDAPCSSC